MSAGGRLYNAGRVLLCRYLVQLKPLPKIESDKRDLEVYQWCEQHCKGIFSRGMQSRFFWFSELNDALLCKLTWGGE